VQDVDRLFENYQYGEAGRQIYEFVWSEFADWYLEIAKIQLEEQGDRALYTAKVMVMVLDTCLRLLHPFTPFVTEALWGHLKAACQAHLAHFSPDSGWEEALIIANWPKLEAVTKVEQESIKWFPLFMDLVRGIRNLRSEKGVDSSRRIPAILVSGEHTQMIRELEKAIVVMARVDPTQLQIHSSIPELPSKALALVTGPIEAYFPQEGLLDLKVEKARLAKELDAIEEQVGRLEELLAGPFSNRAPQDVVEKERTRLEALLEARNKLVVQLEALER
jgi:valyl-tRNA synthetase